MYRPDLVAQFGNHHGVGTIALCHLGADHMCYHRRPSVKKKKGTDKYRNTTPETFCHISLDGSGQSMCEMYTRPG